MSMSDRDGFIWQDGKLVPWRDATTHVLTHSLHYGMGVFEGVRAYKTERGTAIFRLKEHTERLFRSAHIFQMAGRLVEGQPDLGFLLDQQELAVATNNGGNGNVGFPDHDKTQAAKALF